MLIHPTDTLTFSGNPRQVDLAEPGLDRGEIHALQRQVEQHCGNADLEDQEDGLAHAG